MRARRDVSPSRTRSPTVGPYASAYADRLMTLALPSGTSTPDLTTSPNPPSLAFIRPSISSHLDMSAFPPVRPLPHTTLLFPPRETRVTVLDSPGSNRTDAPDGTLRRRPSESFRSNTRAGFARNAVPQYVRGPFFTCVPQFDDDGLHIRRAPGPTRDESRRERKREKKFCLQLQQ